MAEFVKVKFKKSHPLFSYFEGELATIDSEQASKLESEGYVEIMTIKSKKE